MSKKEKQKEIDVKDHIVLVALDLAQQRGWAHVGLKDIAQGCDMTLMQLYDVIDHKDEVLALFARMVDKKMLENFSSGDSGSSARERIFDMLMDRYEILNTYRAGFVAILRSFKYEPKQAVMSMPYVFRSMIWVLENAGVETSGLAGALKVAGVTGVYLKGLKVWLDDESADLSKTMAALDRALHYGEQAVTRFGL